MIIERRVVDKEKGIVQITTEDERFYLVDDVYYPSVTWIASYYPKGVHFYKWLANKGWDEAEAIKEEAGAKGSRVHIALEMLLAGETIKIDQMLHNNLTGEPESFTAEEWKTILSFVDWYRSLDDIEIIFTESTIINTEENFAGTVDLLCKIGGEYWIVDFKTSASIYPSHEIQISAYRKTLEKEYPGVKTAILQVGYNRNKRGWKFTEIEDKYHLFKAAQEIWKAECDTDEPKQHEYPLELSLQ